MDSYTTLALDWLAGHPSPSTVTAHPQRWAEQTSTAIIRRIRELVDQLAPTIPGETFPDRRARLNTARLTATELAIDELLPSHAPPPDHPDSWTPLLPDLTDLL